MLERHGCRRSQIARRVGTFQFERDRLGLVLGQHDVSMQACAVGIGWKDAYVGVFQRLQASEVGVSVLHVALVVEMSGVDAQVVHQCLRMQIQFVLVINRKSLVVDGVVDSYAFQCGRLHDVKVCNETDAVHGVLFVGRPGAGSSGVQVHGQVHFVRIEHGVCGIGQKIFVETVNKGNLGIDEDEEDVPDYSEIAKSPAFELSVRQLALMKKIILENQAATRGDFTGITCSRDGKVVFIKIDCLKNKDGEIVKQVVEAWDTGLNINNLPESPVFGKYDKAAGKYTMNNVLGIEGSVYEINVAFENDILKNFRKFSSSKYSYR